MDAWNQANQEPEWRYARESIFRRDAKDARERLLTPSISLKQSFKAFAESPQTETRERSRSERT
jgi:hypothetical protein